MQNIQRTFLLSFLFIGLFLFVFVFSFLVPQHAGAQESASVSISPTCLLLPYNLSFGQSDASGDGDVMRLQKFLLGAGYFPASAPFGYFGPVTLGAVKKFQLDHDVPQTGFVGPMTRNAVRSFSCVQQSLNQNQSGSESSTVSTSGEISNDSNQTATVVLTPALTLTQKELPYRQDTFFPYNTDWSGDWGNFTISDENHTLLLSATATSTGAEAFLLNADNWTDYHYKVNLIMRNDSEVTLIARHRDSGNFLSCTFSNQWVTLQKHVGGKVTTIASGKNGLPRPVSVKSTLELDMKVKGNKASCGMLEEPFGGYEIADNSLSSGGIGVATWNPLPNVAQAEIRSVNVENL